MTVIVSMLESSFTGHITETEITLMLPLRSYSNRIVWWLNQPFLYPNGESAYN